MSQCTRSFADLIDVTLADEDNNPILYDDVDKTIQGKVKSIATWWQNLWLTQVAPPKVSDLF